VKRFEIAVGGTCALVWLVATILLQTGGLELERFPPPRALFSFAAILGWIAGNAFMSRIGPSGLTRRALVSIYLGGPPSLLWLLWACVPAPVQAESPLVPLLSLGIYGIFFLVPVTLRKRQ